VPAAAGRQEDKPKRLLFVGRISPEKGVHVLVQAMHQVVAQMPNVHLDIVGTPGDLPYEYIVLLGQHETVTDLAAFYPGVLRRGNYYEAVQRMAEPLAQHITFAGSVPHERVVDFYHNTDLLVNPSLSESFGMSLIEAMASNVPVVVSQVGGMTDIVRHEDNGLFVEPGNTEQLARAILDVLKNDQKRDRLTQSGRASLTDRFSWDAVANRLLTLYDAVL
jgi:glycosyltransferase involved in cell wall biosynthesis